jgi:hypothetical protein
MNAKLPAGPEKMYSTIGTMNSSKESAYTFIPNNFKLKTGVAFAAMISKIKLDEGLAGIFNMGNTCFINTGKLRETHRCCSGSMPQQCPASHRLFHW